MDKEAELFSFPTIEKKGLSIVLFDAKQYLKEHKHTQLDLTSYLKAALNTDPIPHRELENLWVPMSRFPLQYNERQDNYVSTHRVQDLKPIKKELLVGDQFEWFCSMQMQNGIKFQKTKNDIVLEKPLGIAIMAMEDRIVFYARVQL